VLPHFVSTELAAGIRATPSVPLSSPEHVANAVLDALRHNHYEVWIPKRLAVTWAVANLLPLRVRDVLSHALRFDRAMVEADRSARAAYEARAAASAPAAEEAAAASAAEREEPGEPEEAAA
jgi:hypothetical protein